ncbi:PREDICTED: uncharacterized protein DDB_G0288629-like [Ipomoea nil]|uniref:uncharacterized protein DDB_G0288629-like n=1 Tax=Ipomoea nil TaxID=35883 RepID=UPI000901043F|nr:PREDICTED: uncharacterized protein DDB_G0288629-like [Ipomoea nil]
MRMTLAAMKATMLVMKIIHLMGEKHNSLRILLGIYLMMQLKVIFQLQRKRIKRQETAEENKKENTEEKSEEENKDEPKSEDESKGEKDNKEDKKENGELKADDNNSEEEEKTESKSGGNLYGTVGEILDEKTDVLDVALDDITRFI